MNSKSFAMFAASVLFLAMLVSSVSAFDTNVFSQINQSQPISASSLSLDNISGISIASPLTAYIQNTNFSTFLVSHTNTSLNIMLQNIDPNNNYYGGSSIPFNVTGVNSSGDYVSTPVNLRYLNSFCDYGDVNDSKLELAVSVSNGEDLGISGSSSTTWNPLDTIKVEVTVYNDNNFDINNVMLEMGLVQVGTNKDITNKLDWLSGDDNKASLDTISNGDSVTYIFEFKVDPTIIKNYGSGDYLLMVKAYPQNKEDQMCIDYSSDFDSPNQFGGSKDYASNIFINTPSRDNAVVIDPSSISSSTSVTCGQQISFDPTVYNIGSNGNSYSQNQMLLAMSIPQLGIKQNVTIYGDLNSGDFVQIPTPLSFTIPRNAEEQPYDVHFTLYYGYSETSGSYMGLYRWISNDFKTGFNVNGNCVYATPATTQIEAQLQSGGKAGEPLVIQATVTNTGNKTVSYNFGAEGYSSWSTLSDISPMNVTLVPGQSQTVVMNMNVNKDATGGDKQFYLDVYSNGYLITQQPLSLTVTPRFSLANITGGVISGDNIALWTFNIVLIIAIVVVLIIVLRRKRTA